MRRRRARISKNLHVNAVATSPGRDVTRTYATLGRRIFRATRARTRACFRFDATRQRQRRSISMHVREQGEWIARTRRAESSRCVARVRFERTIRAPSSNFGSIRYARVLSFGPVRGRMRPTTNQGDSLSRKSRLACARTPDRCSLCHSRACVRACMRACMRACVRACVRACARVRAVFLEAAKKNRLESPKELCTPLDPQERAYAFRDTNTSVLRNFFADR